MIKYTLKVIDIKQEASNTFSFYMEKPDDLIWIEGAHTHIGIVGFDKGELPNKNLVRHMSINTLPDENKIGFTTRIQEPQSEFKSELSKISIGDELVIFKLGSRLNLRRNNRPIILLSMGVGIATMRPIVHAFLVNSSSISSLVSVNIDSSKNYIFRDELDAIQTDLYKNYWYDCRADFYQSLNEFTELKNPLYYVIGSDNFIKDIIRTLHFKNVKEEDIFLDKKEEVLADYFV
ncbi:MAG: hypothetical protein K0R00_3637 [Herbinix sp.]|jgi:ferredoxin--NADP+ reductase|nr:hypothetical protein [Herbinix sp.]